MTPDELQALDTLLTNYRDALLAHWGDPRCPLKRETVNRAQRLFEQQGLQPAVELVRERRKVVG